MTNTSVSVYVRHLCLTVSCQPFVLSACKRKEQEHGKCERGSISKKPRLVFTDVQRRTLLAIFKENKRPSKELQITISQQLGLELTTVSNFFMNARRRSLDKWLDDGSSISANSSSSSTCTKAWWSNGCIMGKQKRKKKLRCKSFKQRNLTRDNFRQRLPLKLVQ